MTVWRLETVSFQVKYYIKFSMPIKDWLQSLNSRSDANTELADNTGHILIMSKIDG